MQAMQIKYDARTDLVTEQPDAIFETDDLMASVDEFDRVTVREVQGWAPYTHLVVGLTDDDECWMQIAYLTVGNPRC